MFEKQYIAWKRLIKINRRVLVIKEHFKDMFNKHFGVLKKYKTVNCPIQETEVTSTPTKPVDNVVIATKGLQDRKI